MYVRNMTNDVKPMYGSNTPPVQSWCTRASNFLEFVEIPLCIQKCDGLSEKKIVKLHHIYRLLHLL